MVLTAVMTFIYRNNREVLYIQTTNIEEVTLFGNFQKKKVLKRNVSGLLNGAADET